jgi:hypothetical protein
VLKSSFPQSEIISVAECLIPAAYLITFSARASTFGGIVRPICFAAFKLTTSSSFVSLSTGRSARLKPFRILSTYVANKDKRKSSADLRLLSFDRSHLITLSARASTLGGIVRPICLAAFKLIANSNFVGCSTGKSAGLAPFRILST